jgi:hypothetical protein
VALLGDRCQLTAVGHLFADQLDEVADALDAARAAADYSRTERAISDLGEVANGMKASKYAALRGCAVRESNPQPAD